VQRVRVEVHLAEGLRRGGELAVDARLLLVGEGVGHLDDDHAVEQRFVLRLLQELAELGEVGVGEDRLVEMDQREARHLDVLLLGEGEQEIQELALHLQDLDHLEKPPARGEHSARPGPGARVALVAELRDLGKVHRADQVGDVGGGRIVRRVGAHADAAGFGDEDALHRHLHEVAAELVLQAARTERAELARDVDAVGRAELAAHRVRHEVQRRLVHRAAVDAVERAGVGMAVLLQAALEEDHHARLAARGRAEQQQQAPANFGTRGRGLEVTDHPLDGVVDTVKLVLEQATAEVSAGVLEALGAHHVPDVLVAGAGDGARFGGEHGLQEAREGARPVRRAVLLGEIAERAHQARAPLVVVIVDGPYRHVHDFDLSIPSDAINHQQVPMHYLDQANNEPSNGSTEIKLT
jgi:hypothetical protein